MLMACCGIADGGTVGSTVLATLGEDWGLRGEFEDISTSGWMRLGEVRVATDSSTLILTAISS